MNYGKIEIEKIGNIDPFIERIMSSDWIYSDEERTIFAYHRKQTRIFLFDRYKEDVTTSVLEKYNVSQKHLNNLSELNLFSKQMYMALIENKYSNDLGNYFSADSFGSFFGHIDAMKEIEIDSLIPECQDNGLTFNIDKQEFVELVRAILETKRVVVGKTKQQVIEYFSKVLHCSISVDDFHEIARRQKKRKCGSETIFLNELRDKYIDWTRK